MKNFTKFACVMIAVLAVSCQIEQEMPIIPHIDTNIVTSESFVSFDKAISNANFVYKNIDNEHKRKIQDVKLLTRSDINSTVTRSSSQEEPLAYVVNYKNEQGFAILAATDDLPPIIALGDSGRFSIDKFIEYVSGKITRSNEDDLCPEQELQYEIINNSLNLTVERGLGPSITLGNPTDTTILLKCMPLVPEKWGQWAPYNKYSPVISGTLCPAGCVPVAYAQSLASLCYHHNYRPSVQINSEYPVDWYTINQIIAADTIKYESYQDTPGSRNVAKLIRAIGNEINATYTPTGTSATANNAMRMYNKIGLKNVQLKYNNDPEIISHLFSMIVDKNYPVNCHASRIEEDGDIMGHCFNADGWLRLQYTNDIVGNVTVNGQTSIGVDHVQYKFDLLHINFGWSGTGDGYYLPGAFDTSSDTFDEYKEENDSDTSMNRNYNLNVRYVTFEL